MVFPTFFNLSLNFAQRCSLFEAKSAPGLALAYCIEVLSIDLYRPLSQDWKKSLFIPVPKKGSAKECSSYRTITFTSHASKVMLKTLKARLQQYMNQEIPDTQSGSTKGRWTRDQLGNICWIIDKAREFQKNIYLCFFDYVKAFVWITTKCGKFFKRWEYQTTLPISCETCIQINKQ